MRNEAFQFDSHAEIECKPKRRVKPLRRRAFRAYWRMEDRGTPQAHAKAAGLHYVSDAVPGYSRRQKGRDFVFLNASGKPIRDENQISRIRKLAIPPAWTEVWICPDPNGHVQA